MPIQGEELTNRVIGSVAVKLGIDESIVKKVNSFQYKQALNGLRKFKCVEITDLGVFKLRSKAVERELKFYEMLVGKYKSELSSPDLNEVSEKETLLKSAQKKVDFLKTKV